MNERIKDLMKQAGFDPAAIERMGVMTQSQKFAELIVKECIDIADQESKTQKSDHGKQAADRIWHTIRNRFGS